jgi:hypothetical protein
MFPPASDFMKSLYLFSLILSSHFIRSEPVKILLRGNLSPSLIKNIVQDYGHQAVAIMLSCNGVILNYAFVMYNKSISKIDIVQNIAKELPVPPVMSYFLCDCWYVSEKIINTFAERGFHTIGALKTNRILYPFGIRCLLKRFLCLLQCDPMQPAAQVLSPSRLSHVCGALDDMGDTGLLLPQAFPLPESVSLILLSVSD